MLILLPARVLGSYMIPDLSIVIPCYNAATYLSNTLDCLLNQSYQNFYIYIIDDGSSDETSNISMFYVNRDCRVKYFYKSNSGAGDSRNYGLNLVDSKYVMFLDADDLYHRNFLRYMRDAIAFSKSEVAICKSQTFRKISDISLSLQNSFENSFSSVSTESIYYKLFDIVNPAPWNKIFSTSFIKNNKLHFQNLRHANDAYFCYMAFVLSSSITFVNSTLMYYRVGLGSSLQDNLYKSPLCDLQMLEKVSSGLSCRFPTNHPIINSFNKYCIHTLFNHYQILLLQNKSSLDKYRMYLYSTFLNNISLYIPKFPFPCPLKSYFLFTCICRISVQGFSLVYHDLSCDDARFEYLINGFKYKFRLVLVFILSFILSKYRN